MDVVVKLVLALHIFAMVLGLGSGFASRRVGPLFGGSSQEQKTILFQMGRGLAKNGNIGLALLWVTGIALVFLRGWDITAMPLAFWFKMLFVVILSAAVGISSKASRQFAAGDMAASTKAAMFGWLAAVSGVIIIICAVFAFS